MVQKYSRILNVLDNADDILETGIYSWSGASMPGGIPSEYVSGKGGQLMVVYDRASGIHCQFIWQYDDGVKKICTRRKYAGVWSSWVKIITENEINPVLTKTVSGTTSGLATISLGLNNTYEVVSATCTTGQRVIPTLWNDDQWYGYITPSSVETSGSPNTQVTLIVRYRKI